MATILDQIGATPLVRLRRCLPSNGAEIWLKLENQNPTGSMKDRVALAMIEGAEREGLIEPGRTTIVEYSGGSTGPALALVCSVKGYRCRIVISDSHTEERIQLMRALGAEVEIVPSVDGRPPRVSAEDIRRMAERSAELSALPDHYATLQFTSPYIVPAVRDGLGREIWEQTSGRVTAFVQGVGTAGSVIGVAHALKPRGVHIYALEPSGSAALSGGDAGSFATQGWSGMVPPRWDWSWVDEVEQIEDHEAIEMTRRIAREEGIFAGISTGANVVGALRVAERLGPHAVVVTIAVDTGFKYMSVAPYGEPTFAAGLVGRDKELAAVESFLAAVATGPQRLVLEGGLGIGKTAVWRAALRGARRSPYTVLSCRPSEPRAGRSFGALAELLETVGADVLARLPAAQRRALGAALGTREPSAPPAPRAVALALLGVLRDLARTHPVVIAVDDAHWLDAASAAAIASALHAPGSDRVSVLIALDTDHGAPFDLDGFVRLPLEPLSLGALQRLLQDRLGAVPPRPQVVRVHRASGGNPFAALELASAGSSPSPADEAVTAPRLVELLRARLAGVPDDALETMLELAAVSAPRASMVAPERLERATSSGVVAIEGDRIRFSHPLMAAAVYEGASPALRAKVHRRLAGQLDSPEERARHLLLAIAGPSDEVARALEQAARHVGGLGAPAAAAELAGLALARTPHDDRPAMVRRRLLAAGTLIADGRTPAARELLGDVIGGLGPGVERAQARLLLATTRVDNLEEATALATRALVDAGEDEALRAEISLHLASLWWARGERRRAVAHAKASRAAAETLGDARLLVRVLSLIAVLEGPASAGGGDGTLDLALELERETERPAGAYSPRLALGFGLLEVGRLDDARTAFERDHRDASEAGDDVGRAVGLVHLAQVELRAGRWDVAGRYAREAVELGDELALPLVQASALAMYAHVCAHRGAIGDAQTAACRGARLAADVGAALHEVENVAALGFAELSARRAQAADGHLRSLLADGGLPTRIAANAIEAMIEAGFGGDARAHVDAFTARAHGTPWGRGAMHRVQGMWLAASGVLDDAEEALHAAVREHEISAEPFERARSLLALGTVLRRGRQKRTAREALDAALALFEQLGATTWAEGTRAELARIAGRRPGSTALTATEARVAELVADGLSNKEVAATLHLTVKTVEGSLSRIYEKLGVPSRARLAAHFARREVTRAEMQSH